MTPRPVELSVPAPTSRQIEDAFYRTQRQHDKCLALACASGVLGILILMVVQGIVEAEVGVASLAWVALGYTLVTLGACVYGSGVWVYRAYKPVSAARQKTLAARCVAFPVSREYLADVEAQGRRFVRCEAVVLGRWLAVAAESPALARGARAPH